MDILSKSEIAWFEGPLDKNDHLSYLSFLVYIYKNSKFHMHVYLHMYMCE